MDLMELLLRRRSVRRYTGQPIPEEKLERILKAGLAAPSGRNIRPWDFVVVRDRDMLEKLSGCRPMGSQILAGADAAVVVLGDAEATDVWTEDCSIAMTCMHLMAAEQGVGSCWIQGRLREAPDGGTAEAVVKHLLNVPEPKRLEAILCLGMPEKEAEAHKEEDLLTERIHWGIY